MSRHAICSVSVFVLALKYYEQTCNLFGISVRPCLAAKTCLPFPVSAGKISLVKTEFLPHTNCTYLCNSKDIFSFADSHGSLVHKITCFYFSNHIHLYNTLCVNISNCFNDL